MWLVVKRNISGEIRYYWERMATMFKSKDSIDGRFLDSYLVYEGAPTTQVVGLDHLEGESISVMVDGAAHPDVQVVNGTITLRLQASHVVAGLPFVSEVEPLLPELATEEGSSLTREQRIINLNISLSDSLGMTIGKYDERRNETVEEIPFRETQDLTGERLPLFSGIKTINFLEGYHTLASYFIRQTYPFPLTVTHVVNELEVN